MPEHKALRGVWLSPCGANQNLEIRIPGIPNSRVKEGRLARRIDAVLRQQLGWPTSTHPVIKAENGFTKIVVKLCQPYTIDAQHLLGSLERALKPYLTERPAGVGMDFLLLTLYMAWVGGITSLLYWGGDYLMAAIAPCAFLYLFCLVGILRKPA